MSVDTAAPDAPAVQVSPRSAGARPAWPAWLGVASLVLALTALAGGGASLPFLLIGPGLLAASWWRARPAAVLALAAPASIALLILVSSTSLWVGLWAPAAGTALLAVGAAVLAGVRVWADRDVLRRSARVPAVPAPTRAGVLWLAAFGVGVIVWALALPSVASARTSPWGLLASGQPLFLLALAVPVVAIAVAIRRRAVAAVWGAVLLSVLVYRTTGALTDEVPRYAWTYKHIGATDAIIDFGTLFPGVDIYQDWPGFFSAAAWIAEAAGVAPIVLATWITPVVTLMFALAVACLALQLGADRLAAGVAAFLAVALTWVGQDYFAPQAVAMPLAVAVIALALAARRRPAAGAAALPLFAALVISHQLTPVWMLIVLWALVLLRRSRVWVAIAATAIVVVFTATRFEIIERYGVFSSGGVIANASTNVGPVATAGQELASAVTRGSAVLMWGAAAAVVVWLIVRRRPWAAAASVAFSPLVLLALQDYGGEAILRVYLYSVAGCAVLLAPVLVRALSARLPAAIAAGAVLAIAVGLSAQAYFGSWFAYRMTAAQVHVAGVLLDELPREAMIATVVPNWPDRATSGYIDRFQWFWAFDQTAYRDAYSSLGMSSEAELSAFEEGLRERSWVPVFLVFSGSAEPYSQLRGLYADGAIDSLEAMLQGRPDWDLVVAEGDVRVLRYAPENTQWAPSARWSWPQ